MGFSIHLDGFGVSLPDIILIAFAIVAVLEILMSLFWVRIYFRKGIRVVSRAFQYRERPAKPVKLAAGPEEYELDFVWPLESRKLDTGEIVFRQKWLRMPRRFWPPYLYMPSFPVLRGLIRDDPASRTVTVTGRLSWFACLPPVYMVAVGISERHDTLVCLVVGLVMCLLMVG